MASTSTVTMDVEGPEIDEQSEDLAYCVCSPERDVRFWVIPETGTDGTAGWAVRIEGVPAPSIVHEVPWSSPDSAKEAALRAIGSILDLERMQREELERSGVKVEETACAEVAV